MPGTALIKRLSCIGVLSEDDEKALQSLRGKTISLKKNADIMKLGDRPQHSVIVLRGYLCRHAILRDGSAQIFSLSMASDAPSLETLHLDYVDHNLGALVDSKVALVAHSELNRVLNERTNVLGLVWRETLIQGSIYREWMMRNSNLRANARMAHLFCEIFTRAKAANLNQANRCYLPVSQSTLAAALGLTAVHVNRTLQSMRDTGVADLKGGSLIISDFEALAELGEFNPQYLHNRCLSDGSGAAQLAGL